MMNKQEVLSILEQYGLSATKSLGQNFLCNEDVISRILDLAGLSQKSDLRVLEIGPGIGALSEDAVRMSGSYVAVEIDTSFQSRLEDVITDHGGQVIFRDYLQFSPNDLSDERKPDVVISNLPYYVMTPIMLKVMADFPNCRKMVYMVEEEAMERIFARPGTKQYGPLAVMTSLFGKKSKAFTVDRASFVPAPNTTSAVMTIEREEGKTWDPSWIPFVESAFALRRKTLVNSLSSSGRYCKEQIQSALSSMGRKETVRSEEMEPLEFCTLYDILEGRKDV